MSTHSPWPTRPLHSALSSRLTLVLGLLIFCCVGSVTSDKLMTLSQSPQSQLLPGSPGVPQACNMPNAERWGGGGGSWTLPPLPSPHRGDRTWGPPALSLPTPLALVRPPATGPLSLSLLFFKH